MRTGGLIASIGTSLAERKHQLALSMIWENGIKETTRRKHGAFDQAEIGRDIVEVLGDDAWMADNRSRRFITPQVKARKNQLT